MSLLGSCVVEVAHIFHDIFPPLVGYAKQPSLLGVIEGVEGLRTIAASAASISSRVTAVYTHVYFFVLYVWHTSIYIKTFAV